VTSLSKTTQEVVETRTSSSLLSELLLFQNKSQSATWELRFLYIFQILSAATHANNFVTGKTPTEEGRHRPSVVKLVTKATIALTRPSVQTALATTLPLARTALNGSLKGSNRCKESISFIEAQRIVSDFDLDLTQIGILHSNLDLVLDLDLNLDLDFDQDASSLTLTVTLTSTLKLTLTWP